MKAVIYEGNGTMKEKNVDLPILENNELLLKVQACGICSSDLRTLLYGSRSVVPPVVLGHEIAGEIVDKTLRGTEYNLGQRVIVSPAIGCGRCIFCRTGQQNHCNDVRKIASHYNGGFAEYIKIPAQAIYGGNINIIPKNIDYLEASLSEPLACVINGQENLNIGPDDTVAVIGAGPLGLLHAEAARLSGAKKILLINRSSKRLKLAESFHYDAYIDLSAEDGIKAVNDMTDGKGANVVIVTVSSAQAVEMGVNMASHMGRVCLFSGFPYDKSKNKLDLNIVHYRQITLYGVFSSAPRHNEAALNLITDGKINIKKIITHIVSLSKIDSGFDIVRAHDGLKVIVVPDMEDLQEDIKNYSSAKIIV
ncbi:alcohol dehydrogenase catalytic domain-containing protein [Pectinatus haikarae]|uniref:L-iditol 2-dehydrogenase n=1 Tax=Pectinatus haikarae TaxID=349096 RepID=A0ABT9Y8H4_9FIRM|nr:alcohol dehydrogenase catalytic domain-containing protein [Pectinatus haikarae]MDQ0204139.1 L-iditol 2-dehydrogenase [Pectinatus haikarae]